MRQKRRPSRSVFEYCARRAGQDLEPAWEPLAPADRPSDDVPGSEARKREYRRRLELGREMWHKDDRKDYEGLA